MYVEDLIKQDDGRYTLIFSENGKTYIQENMGICFQGTYQNDTGNDSDCRYYHIHFEVLVSEDFHPPKEIK